MPRLLLTLAAALSLVACDSSVEPPTLFSALQGTWQTSAGSTPTSIRFLERDRYEFVFGNEVTERGRYSISTIGDSENLASLQDLQFYTDGSVSPLTVFQVVSADSEALALQECWTTCDGVAVTVYRRQ